MQLVVDANVLVSALVADSKTRELIVLLEPSLCTPEIIHDEIDRHHETIVAKSGLDDDRVQQFLDLLFQHIETVPIDDFHHHIERAENAIGDTDPDDVLYVACALGYDAGIWSDDSDYDQQDLVPVFTTADVIESFDTV